MDKHVYQPLTRLKSEPVSVKLETGQTLAGWLGEKASTMGNPVWFLAFADDGVIWGIKKENQPLAFSTPLSEQTLQTAHLFCNSTELRLWKQDGGIKACFITDQNGVESFDTGYMLWGTQVELPGDVFSLVSDGRQGLRHAAPVALKGSSDLSSRPLRLITRSYLAEDADGQVFVSSSRLVRVEEKNAA